jgi:DNA invertase Pin-like site-specific DNA recombinase
MQAPDFSAALAGHASGRFSEGFSRRRAHGLSGASSHARLGFQRLVAAIGLGEVGIVLVTEVSRLSRRNSDWHRVIELCAVFRTLIADEDGVYDAQGAIIR